MPRRTPPGRVQDVARAACEVFIEKGYRRALMTDVAERLEINHALLYRYVESKEALLELAARYAIDQGADLDAVVPLATPQPGQILELMRGWLAVRATFPALARRARTRPGRGRGRRARRDHRELYDFVEQNRLLLLLIESLAGDYPELGELCLTEKARPQRRLAPSSAAEHRRAACARSPIRTSPPTSSANRSHGSPSTESATPARPIDDEQAARLGARAAAGGVRARHESNQKGTRRRSLMTRFARWCFRRRRLVLAGWLIALVGLAAAGHAAGIGTPPSTPCPTRPPPVRWPSSSTTSRRASGDTDQIVVQAKTGAVTSAPARSEVEAMLAKVGRLPHVEAVVSPFGPGGSSQISRDGRIAFATVDFDAQAQDLPIAAVTAVIDTAQAARGPNLRVDLGGQAIENAQPQKSSDSTALGVIFALIVLGILFGAVLAAVIPIITALDRDRDRLRVHRLSCPTSSRRQLRARSSAC